MFRDEDGAKDSSHSSALRAVSRLIVMPAGIAGIEVRKDASRNIHVNLDSSSPC